MRKTLTTATLVLALSCPAWAGIMHTPDAPTPPPQPASAIQEPTLNGEMPNGVAESLTQITLVELLAVLPSLL